MKEDLEKIKTGGRKKEYDMWCTVFSLFSWEGGIYHLVYQLILSPIDSVMSHPTALKTKYCLNVCGGGGGG